MNGYEVKIQRIMKAAGINQRELAERVGVAQCAVSHWVRGLPISTKNRNKVDEIYKRVVGDDVAPVYVAKNVGIVATLDDQIAALEKKLEELKAKRWVFTNDEKVILSCLDEHYRFIARDSDGDLCVYTDKPFKEDSVWLYHNSGADIGDLTIFSHLFKSIKWEDTNPCEFRKFI